MYSWGLICIKKLNYYSLIFSSSLLIADLRSVSSTDEDPYAGLEEVDAQTRKDINQRLGNRSGLRWSLPTIPHRASLATTSRRLKFRPSVSLCIGEGIIINNECCCCVVNRALKHL